MDLQSEKPSQWQTGAVLAIGLIVVLWWVSSVENRDAESARKAEDAVNEQALRDYTAP